MRKNTAVAEAWARVEAEKPCPHPVYLPAPISNDIFETQVSKYGIIRDVSYDSDAFIIAGRLLEQSLHYNYGMAGGLGSLDSIELITAGCVSTANDKSPGPVASLEGKVSTKADWYFESDKKVPLDESFQGAGRLEATARWIRSYITGEIDSVAEAFTERFCKDGPDYGGALKRELRAPDKVAALKTRAFTPSEVWDVGLGLAIFGALSYLLHSSWRSTHAFVRVGLSRVNGGWEALCKIFDVCTGLFTSDASGWDTSVISEVKGVAAYAMSGLMKRKKAAKRYLVERIYARIIGMNGCIYQKLRGGASGDFMTSDWNSIERHFAQLYAVVRWAQVHWCGPKMEKACLTLQFVQDHFRFATFGDDAIEGVIYDEDVNLTPETYNAWHLSRCGAELGMVLEYTNESGPMLNTKHSFLGAYTVEYCGRRVPMSERPGKVLSNLQYASTNPDVLKGQFDAAALNLCFDDESWDWFMRLAGELKIRGLHHRREYQNRYLDGIGESQGKLVQKGAPPRLCYATKMYNKRVWDNLKADASVFLHTQASAKLYSRARMTHTPTHSLFRLEDGNYVVPRQDAIDMIRAAMVLMPMAHAKKQCEEFWKK